MMRMRIVKKVLEVENGDDDDTYSQMAALCETLMMMMRIRIVKIIDIDIDNGDGDGDNTYSQLFCVINSIEYNQRVLMVR